VCGKYEREKPNAKRRERMKNENRKYSLGTPKNRKPTYRMIRVSADVNDAIAARGTFGDTHDDVLRRIFRLKPNPAAGNGHSRRNFTIQKQRAEVKQENGRKAIVIEYENGMSNRWELPVDAKDKVETRTVLRDAFRFAEANNATQGQLNAIRKAISGAGYYLTK
jgi:hypothetical protein